jgi:diguanylate cyclase
MAISTADTIKNWMFPSIPDEIRGHLLQVQFANIRQQVPMLLAVAALNVLIIMVVCFERGVPIGRFGWLGILVVYCVGRIVMWTRHSRQPFDPAQMTRLLRHTVIATLVMISVLGIVTAVIFVADFIDSGLLIPMSLGFGATSIAHCLYSLRPAAIGALVLGLVPPSLAMLFGGAFDAQMLALSMLSVGFLMTRFVAAQYDNLIARLILEQQFEVLANTDPLTGLANRRAVMGRLDGLHLAHAPFAVALLDLNGFKQVNDTLGHHIGDALLVEVGARLSSGVGADHFVGRLGGDEFIAVWPGKSDARAISGLSVALLARLSQPTQIDGHTIPIGCSLGSAISGVDGDTVDALLQHADRALYAAKRESAGGERRTRAA